MFLVLAHCSLCGLHLTLVALVQAVKEELANAEKIAKELKDEL
jgi:hypothetical protein